MKKLMIAAAVALVGIAANAATYNWSATADFALTKEDPETYAGFFNAYIFDANVNNYAATLTALANQDTLAATLAKAANFGQTDDVGGFLVEGIGTIGGGTGTTGLAANDGKLNYFLVLLDSNGAATAKNFWASEVLDYALSASEESGTPAGLAFGEIYATEGWTKVESVPEPTSGLLLLLGVAGLALRRRRA